jgi:protein-disulfide isomerase
LFVPYYLTDVNPAIIQEMVEGMQAQQQAEKNKMVRKYVREHADEMIADAPVLGNESAENTIYVWTAASCGYCRRVHGELERVLADRDDVRVVIKNFSIHGVMSDAPARAMIAAKLQGNDKAAKLVDMIMTREYRPQGKTDDQEKLAAEIEKNIMKFATEAGLDTKQLKTDMNGEVVARELANVRDLAQIFEISGTPFLIINEQAFPGAIPANQIKAALDK